MPIKNDFSSVVLKNFSNAAINYENKASVQKSFAFRLAKICSQKSIPSGLWADLGSGTGFLAEELEKVFPGEKLIRVDISQRMLDLHSPHSSVEKWDLNLGLPHWDSSPNFLASNFALHWLKNPPQRLREWFNAIQKDGWLAICLPIEGSFPEWKQAAKNAGVKFTALNFPEKTSLLKEISIENIKYQKVEVFTQQEKCIKNLFHPILKTGAQTSNKELIQFKDIKKLLRSWPINHTSGTFDLTWCIQIILIKK